MRHVETSGRTQQVEYELRELARAYDALGEPHKAAECRTRAARLRARRLRHEPPVSSLAPGDRYLAIALDALTERRVPEAIEAAEQAVDAALDAHDRRGILTASTLLAEARDALGDREGAFAALARGRVALTRLGDMASARGAFAPHFRLLSARWGRSAFAQVKQRVRVPSARSVFGPSRGARRARPSC